MLAALDLSGLSLAVGCAVADTLDPGGERIRLKWPNDLFLDGAKLGGILIETTPLPREQRGVVIGIGLNLQPLPADVDRSAFVSGHAALHSLDPAATAHATLDRLAPALRALLADFETLGFGPWQLAFSRRDLTAGRRVRVGEQSGVARAARRAAGGHRRRHVDGGRLPVDVAEVVGRVGPHGEGAARRRHDGRGGEVGRREAADDAATGHDHPVRRDDGAAAGQADRAGRQRQRLAGHEAAGGRLGQRHGAAAHLQRLRDGGIGVHHAGAAGGLGAIALVLHDRARRAALRRVAVGGTAAARRREGPRGVLEDLDRLGRREARPHRGHQADDAADDGRREAGADRRPAARVGLVRGHRRGGAAVGRADHRVQAGLAAERVDAVAARRGDGHVRAQAGEADLGADMAQRGHRDDLTGRIELKGVKNGQIDAVQARLTRLSLPRSEADSVSELMDPAKAGATSSPLPSLDIEVDDFELRGKRMGRLEVLAQAPAAARDWKLEKLQIASPDATLSASGRWGGDTAARRRTQLDWKLDIADAGKLLERLGQGQKDSPVLRGGKGVLAGQVGWDGSPLAPHYPSMAGALNVQLDSGTFLKAEPGVGRLLGDGALRPEERAPARLGRAGDDVGQGLRRRRRAAVGRLAVRSHAADPPRARPPRHADGARHRAARQRRRRGRPAQRARAAVPPGQRARGALVPRQLSHADARQRAHRRHAHPRTRRRIPDREGRHALRRTRPGLARPGGLHVHGGRPVPHRHRARPRAAEPDAGRPGPPGGRTARRQDAGARGRLMTQVWITGLGAVSALGAGADTLADALLAGRSGITAQPGSEAHALKPFAAAVVTEPLGADMPPAQRNLYDRHSLMAMQAAAEAWAQAGLPATAPEPDRAAVAWGTGLGGSVSLESSYQQMFTATPPRVHPYTVVRVMANSAGSHLAMRHQLRAAQFAVSNACASSAQAIGEALWLLRTGRADVALVGGSEADAQHRQRLGLALAEQVSDPRARDAFLGQASLVTGGTGKTAGGTSGAPPGSKGLAGSKGSTSSAGGTTIGGPLNDAVLEKAVPLLAQHVGPIAKVLVKRAAAGIDSRAVFFNRLAESVNDPAAREKLLKELGRLP
ncbi:Beta-ketoacyl synthase protein [Ostertagia ostertagi]